MGSEFAEVDATLDGLLAQFEQVQAASSPQAIASFYALYDSLPYDNPESILFTTEYLNRKMDLAERAEIIVGELRDAMVERLAREAGRSLQPLDEAERVISQYETLAATYLPSREPPKEIAALAGEHAVVTQLEERVIALRRSLMEQGNDRQAARYERESILESLETYGAGARGFLRRRRPLIDVSDIRSRALESTVYANKERDAAEYKHAYQLIPHLLLFGPPPDSASELFEEEVLAERGWDERLERLGSLALSIAPPSGRGRDYLAHLQGCLAASAEYGELHQLILDDPPSARAYERCMRSLRRTLTVTTT